MRRVKVYSPLGDGSTDISTTEQECVGLRICWGGLPRNEFPGLEALDLKDGRDGKSPDAQCLSKCYDRQMGDLLHGEEIGPIGASRDAVQPTDHWLGRAVSCSFDGASVNTGELTSLKSIWMLVAPWLLLVHGIAHVVELACSAAYDSIAFFTGIVTPILSEVVTAYHQSGKKQWNAVRISTQLQEKRWYKLCGFAKTRWQRSLTNATKTVLNNWRTICVHQHSLAHELACTTIEEKRLSLSLESPLIDFVDRYYLTKFTGFGNKMYTVTITGVVDEPGHVGKNDFCGPMLKAKVTPCERGYKQEPLWKSTVVDQLDPTTAKFQTNPVYQLYNRLTGSRFLSSCTLIYDVRKHLARISELTQRDNLSQYSLNKKVVNFEKDMAALMANPGENEADFFLQYNTEKELYKGIQVLHDNKDPASGVDLFKADRTAYLKATLEGITGRVLLKGAVHGARATVFDYDSWLDSDDLPANFLHKELETFAKHYSVQFEREFGEGWFSDLLSEWRVVVQLVVERRDGRWKRYTYNGVWQAVYQHNDIGGKAKLLIEIEIAFIMDTACAERWFSLMANLKDKKRNRMNDQLLNQLMFICLHAPKDILALKKIVNDIRLIWKASKDRYKKKWAQWEVVADQMALDELAINEDF